MFKIRKLMRFEMSHRLIRSYSIPCQHLHGHSYVMEIILCSKTLNEDGMVIDFGALKEIAEKIVERLDHAVVLHHKDELARVLGDNNVVTVPYNPTAEEMARDFAITLMSDLHTSQIESLSVRLHETVTGWAEFEISKEEFYKMIEDKKG